MSKKKKNSQKISAKSKGAEQLNPAPEKKSIFSEPGKNFRMLIYIVLPVISAAFGIYYIYFAHALNSFHSFPLDDPWIHLTFAKNLVDYGSFSYFKNEAVTAGSTSPLYTLVLAVGFIFTNNEMILSYFLGIVFLICSIFFFYKLSILEFRGNIYFALLCTLAVVVDKWLNLIAVSGMETTLYIFFLIAGFYFYTKRDVIPFAILLGLIFWTRPDGIVFYTAVGFDYLLMLFISRSSIRNKKHTMTFNFFSKQDIIKISVITGSILILYFIMNLMLSGSLLPNTYGAKLAAYNPAFRSRLAFLETEVWDYFTAGAYGIFMTGFIFSFIGWVITIIKKQYNENSAYILFVIGFILLYWLMLPYAHKFGRYLMPVIPFLILLAAKGFQDIFELIGKRIKNIAFSTVGFIILMLVIVIYSTVNYNKFKELYAVESKYIYDRQVKAAYWLRDNTKDGDVIGTHDVGAIGFYSKRKIVDIAGLVTPELIDKLYTKDYTLIMTDYMKKHKVTYLAFLREWYRVINQVPLFTTAVNLPPEVMEVYRFIPGKTEILSAELNDMIQYVENLLRQNTYSEAIMILNNSLRQKKDNSYVYFLLAYAYRMTGDVNNAKVNINKALEIFPEFREAKLLLQSL